MKQEEDLFNKIKQSHLWNWNPQEYFLMETFNKLLMTFILNWEEIPLKF